MRDKLAEMPIPVCRWKDEGHDYPTQNGWYNLLRPENQREELVNAGVASFVNGRWLIFPDAWRQYCKASHKPRHS